MIFDSHFHLTSMINRGLSPTLPPSFIGLECGTEPGDGEERIKAVGKDNNIYLSMGAGPWCLSNENWINAEATIKKLNNDISHFGADAIGECGFDHHWNYEDKKDEMELFLMQLEISQKLNIPLIIHSRDADEELLEIAPKLGEKTIMHCFSSSPEVARKLLDRGVFLSFAGNVTYKSNGLIRESAKLCPIDRILYETDSPYLTPVPKRGELNKPEYSEYTLSFLSEIRNEEKEELKDRAVSNFLSLFKNSKSVVRRDFISS